MLVVFGQKVVFLQKCGKLYFMEKEIARVHGVGGPLFICMTKKYGGYQHETY